MNNRRGLLVGVLIVLAALVAIDRFASTGSASEPSDAGTSLSEIYAQKAALLARQKALLAQADEWARASDAVFESWRDVGERLIVAQSVEIAEGELRERLVAMSQESGLPRPDTRAQSVAPGEDDGPLRVVRMNLQLTTPSWSGAFTLIDRIETDPSMMARVTDVTLDGPGLAQLSGTLGVSVTVEAIALIAEPNGGTDR